MSSTTNVQNLLVNVFRPVYQYDANSGTFTTKLNISNIDVIEANSVAGAQIALGDVNSNLYLGSNSGNASDSLRNCVGNTAVGYEAARNISNVSNSIYIGLQAGANATNSANIIAIGCNAAGVGTSNIYLGNTAGSSGTGISNIYIGHGITTSNASNDLRIGMGLKTMIAGDTSTNWVGLGGSLAPVYSSNSVDVSGNLYISGKVGIQVEPNNKSLNVNGGAIFNDGKGIFTIGTDASNNMVVQMESTSGGAGMFVVKGGDVSAYRINSDYLSVTYLDISGVSTALVGATDICTNTLRAVDVSTTTIRAGPGSASTPAYSFRTDTSSGMFLQGANQVGFSTAGLQRMTLSNGNVGIGIVSPSNKLDISYDTRSGTHSSNLALYATKVAGSNTDPIAVIAHANGTQGVGIGYNSIVSAGSSTTQDLHLYSKGNGVITFNDLSGFSEKMRVVSSNGNVGIATTGPTQKLHVAGTILSDTSLLVVPNATYLTRYSSNDSIYALNNLHTDAGYFMGISESQYMGTGTQAALVTSSTLAGLHVIRESSVLTGLIFKTNSTGALERMRITGAGNVGIGATAPAYPLDICGALRASGSIYGSNLGIGNSNPAYAIDVCGTVRASSNLFVTSNVGIGTTLLSNYRLSVRGSGTTNAFIAFHKSTDNFPFVGIGYDETLDAFTVRRNFGSSDLNSTMMTIKRDSGNVGIGTTAPAYVLDVSTGGGVSVPSVNIATQAGNGLLGTWVLASNTIPTSGNYIEGLRWGVNTSNAGYLRFNYFDNGSLNNTITLSPSSNNASIAGLLLNKDGFVGVMKNPSYALDVCGTTNTSNLITGGYIRNALTPTTFDISGGNIRMSNGSVSVPSYSFLSDASLGLYRVGANQLGFVTAGVQRMTLSNGNVGIGTTAPAYTLDVSSGSTPLNVQSSLVTAATPLMFIRQPNLTTTPGDNLAHTVFGVNTGNSNSIFQYFTYVGSGSSSNSYRINFQGQSLASPCIFLRADGNVGIATTAPATTLDVSGTTTSSNLLVGGYIRNALTPTTFDISGGNISNSALHTTANLITSGLYAPVNVDSSAISYISMGVQNNAVASNNNLQFVHFRSGGSAPERYAGINYASFSTANFYTYASGGLLMTKFAGGLLTQKSQLDACLSILSISNNGNVGIGITAPGTTLDVSGTTRSTALRISNVAAGTTGFISANIQFSNYGVLEHNGTYVLHQQATSNTSIVTLSADAGGTNFFSNNVGLGTRSALYPLDISRSAGSASINMSTWPRKPLTTTMFCRGFQSNTAPNTSSVYWVTPTISIDSNLVDFVTGATNGTYFRVLKSGVYSVMAQLYHNAGAASLIFDACTSLSNNTFGAASTTGFAATTNASIVQESICANHTNVINYTGYLPSNSSLYYKFHADSTTVSATDRRGTLSITFLYETSNAASWPW